jgi:hypothetical protein
MALTVRKLQPLYITDCLAVLPQKASISGSRVARKSPRKPLTRKKTAINYIREPIIRRKRGAFSHADIWGPRYKPRKLKVHSERRRPST